MSKNIRKDSPKVLGLDVSTKTIGWSLFDIETGNLLELTHISPIPKPKTDSKIEELLLKGQIFRKKLLDYLSKTNATNYKKILEKLNIRK